jgi:hypothetical protein
MANGEFPVSADQKQISHEKKIGSHGNFIFSYAQNIISQVRW